MRFLSHPHEEENDRNEMCAFHRHAAVRMLPFQQMSLGDSRSSNKEKQIDKLARSRKKKFVMQYHYYRPAPGNLQKILGALAADFAKAVAFFLPVLFTLGAGFNLHDLLLE